MGWVNNGARSKRPMFHRSLAVKDATGFGSEHSRLVKLCIAATLLAVVAACGGGGGGEPTRTTTTVTLTNPTLSPKEGDTLQMTAVARNQFGDVIAGTTATWSSSDTGFATVDTVVHAAY